jgi:hypothetical protein
MDDQTVLEIYKTYVDSSLRLTELRHSANRFNLTVVSGIVAAAWMVISRNGATPLYGVAVALIAACLVGVIGRIWKLNICYFRDLSSAKFKVIHKMEDTLPVKPFTDEWTIVNSNSRCKRTLTNWEEYLPTALSWMLLPTAICMLVYLLMLLCSYDELAAIFQ